MVKFRAVRLLFSSQLLQTWRDFSKNYAGKNGKLKAGTMLKVRTIFCCAQLLGEMLQQWERQKPELYMVTHRRNWKGESPYVPTRFPYLLPFHKFAYNIFLLWFVKFCYLVPQNKLMFSCFPKPLGDPWKGEAKQLINKCILQKGNEMSMYGHLNKQLHCFSNIYDNVKIGLQGWLKMHVTMYVCMYVCMYAMHVLV